MLEELADVMKKCEGLLIQAQASSILDSNQDLTKDMSKLSITSDKRVSYRSPKKMVGIMACATGNVMKGKKIDRWYEVTWFRIVRCFKCNALNKTWWNGIWSFNMVKKKLLPEDELCKLIGFGRTR